MKIYEHLLCDLKQWNHKINRSVCVVLEIMDETQQTSFVGFCMIFNDRGCHHGR